MKNLNKGKIMDLQLASQRVFEMLQVAGIVDKSQDDILRSFELSGIEKNIEKLNELYDTNISLGDFIIISEKEAGFWSNDFGWVFNKNAATGYTEEDLLFYKDQNGIAQPNFSNVPDAKFISFNEAVNFD
jgi:hypothetical protein